MTDSATTLSHSSTTPASALPPLAAPSRRGQSHPNTPHPSLTPLHTLGSHASDAPPSSRNQSRPRGRGRGRGSSYRGRSRPSRRPNPTTHSAEASGSNANAPDNYNQRRNQNDSSGPSGRRRHRHPRHNQSSPTYSAHSTARHPSHSPLQQPSQNNHPRNAPTAVNTSYLPVANIDDSSELSAKLSGLMMRGEVECPVCLDRIRRGTPIWSCQTCYTITHLNCARKWANRSNADGDASTEAACPSCRAPIPPDSLRNLCYCGRQTAPRVEPGLVPGSCGETCLKPRGAPGSKCPHRCSSLCHPGPCVPCLVAKPPQPCLCGATTVSRVCGEAGVVLSCGGVCGKELPCGHKCKQVCHDGACDECTEMVDVPCFCGKHTMKLVCGVKSYACEEVCGKILSCGNHRCTNPCHDGECPPCKRSPSLWSTCACGKKILSPEERQKRESCLDPIPSCGQICGRPLGCLGDHGCGQICGHTDECGDCKLDVNVECRCGSTVFKVGCGESLDVLRQILLCDRKCNDRLTCRQHNCATVCCPFKKRKASARNGVIPSERVWQDVSEFSSLSNAERRRIGHKCDGICGKPLSCGKHDCDLTCGHQGECPPCGILQRDPLLCSCGAESIFPPVRCGTAPPTCRRPCSKVRECGHQCRDNCHPGDCPPCVEVVQFSCLGGHGETRFVQCQIGSKGIRCYRSCGRPLKCGVHACRKPCHGGFPEQCETSSIDGCAQPCGLPQRKCQHSCTQKCHPGMMCPDIPCKHPVQVTCPCGRRKEEALCLRGGQSTVSETEGNIRLNCDGDCTSQERLRGFAEALGRDMGGSGASEQSKDDHIEFPDFLYNFAETEPKMLAYFERGLGLIVQGRSKKMVLDDLPQLHRLVLHNLAELYLLDSESKKHNRGLSRQIVVCHRGAGVKPVYPVPLLSEAYAQREQEKKRNREAGRRLAIHVGAPRGMSATATMEEKVESVLKQHAGYFRITGKATLTNRLVGVAVDFSTVERATAALSSLKMRAEVCVESGAATTAEAPKTAHVTNQVAPKRTAALGTWNDDVRFGGLATAQNILPPARPASPSPDAEIDEDVPDSWDD